MEFHPKECVLKNNKTVIIRQCTLDDVDGLIETVKTYLADSDCIPLDADEFNPTIEQEEQWIQSFITNENSLLLVATNDGKIIGNIDLNGNQRRALKHTAMIGMGMLSEWRNTGLGTALMNCGIEWARENPVLELLWLQVYANNVGGIALYKNSGFVENGVQTDFFKKDDEYFDNVTMNLSVK